MSTDRAVSTISPDAEVGERVHQLIWRKRLSQSAVAGQLGVSQSAMSKKLRGERPWYTGELIAAASLLDVPVGYLFGEGSPEPVETPPSSVIEADFVAPVVYLADRRAQRAVRAQSEAVSA